MIGSRILGAAAGFLIGSITLLLFYTIILSVMSVFDLDHVRFRIPIALFFLPLIAAFIGFKFAPDIIQLVKELPQSTSATIRIAFYAPFIWSAIVMIYIFSVKPFGNLMDSAAWLSVGQIVFGPSAILWCWLIINGDNLVPKISSATKAKYKTASTAMRLIFITPFFWTAVVLAYIFVFEPFGYRMHDSDWQFTAKIILFPSAILWIGTLIYIKFITRK